MSNKKKARTELGHSQKQKIRADQSIKIGPFILLFFLFLTLFFLLWIPLSPYFSYATLWPLTWLFPWLLGISIKFTAQPSFWESAFTPIVSFLALMAATPSWKVNWRKRTWQTILGLFILYILRVADRFLGYWLTKIGAPHRWIPALSFLIYFLIEIGKILFPIFLWLLFCWKELQLFRQRNASAVFPSARGLDKQDPVSHTIRRLP